MLNLKLRDEFLGAQMPGTAISLCTSDNQGAVQKSANYILSITYPTADIQTALKAIGSKRSGSPIVLMGDRGRGKSHIMAVMHHAINSPSTVESWLYEWGEKLDDSEMKNFKMVQGFFPISEPVQNNEYPLLWNLLFDRHPKGDFYRGKFEGMEQSYPPRSLLEEMFEDCPTCLILDEFQTWITGLPEIDPKTGFMLRQWAFNFVQNLSEIAKDSPKILIFVTSLLNNNNEAFQQIHRQGPVLIDFRGNTAKQDRKRLLLHRLFENRRNIPDCDIQATANVYASERFRLLHPNKSESEKDQKRQEVFECWPFSPELIELLEDHILLSQVAQETRDMIRILAHVYRSHGNYTPIITPAHFYVDGDSEEVQTLVDSIANQAGQEKLREIAQHNLETVREAGVEVPDARELVSSIWMRSMSPGKNIGGTPAELHLDITSQHVIDDNAFQAEITLLVENSVNIHTSEEPRGAFWFGLHENPRSKVRAFAKNDKLWQVGADTDTGQTVHPGKDIEHIRKTLRSIFVPENKQQTSRVIVLGTKWKDDPWSEVINEADMPAKWNQPVLLVIPEKIGDSNADINACLGTWLVKHVQIRHNTVRFLLLKSGTEGLYNDKELIHLTRCSYLCSREAWGGDTTYRALHHGFDNPLRSSLKNRFNRFAILHKWDFQNPKNCVFHIEKIYKEGEEIPGDVESKILSNLFEPEDFKTFVVQQAKDSNFVGSLVDDLTNPPVPNTGEAIPFLGETKIYERILDIVAQGDIILNVAGTWIGRRPEDQSDSDALRYVNQKAFRTGQEMRQVELGLPGAIGGTTIAPKEQTGGNTSIDPPGSQAVEVTPFGGGDDAVNNGSVNIKKIPTLPATTVAITRTKQSDEEATGINLMGNFEKWGIASTHTIDSAKIELIGMTAQQIKQILQRIPSTFKAKLEITYKEGDEQ
ncbi:hypothetical protein [Methanococcoides alaskense]|nr:hypothetical protein [Methanococcoides alaskense]MDA0524213.1 hypothetical protein [Methanococcoides alaskense]